MCLSTDGESLTNSLVRFFVLYCHMSEPHPTWSMAKAILTSQALKCIFIIYHYYY